MKTKIFIISTLLSVLVLLTVAYSADKTDNFSILVGTYAFEKSTFSFYEDNRFCYYTYDDVEHKMIEEYGEYSHDTTNKELVLNSVSFHNSAVTSNSNGKKILVQINNEEYEFNRVSKSPSVIIG